MKIIDPTDIPQGYNQKNRTTFVLLAIFLGCWGAHEFYRGNKVKGGTFAVLNFLSIVWLWGGVFAGYIFWYPVILPFVLYIDAIKSAIKEKYDNNGVVMK